MYVHHQLLCKEGNFFFPFSLHNIRILFTYIENSLIRIIVRMPMAKVFCVFFSFCTINLCAH